MKEPDFTQSPEAHRDYLLVELSILLEDKRKLIEKNKTLRKSLKGIRYDLKERILYHPSDIEMDEREKLGETFFRN